MLVEPPWAMRKEIGPEEMGCHVTRKTWAGVATSSKDGVNVGLNVLSSTADRRMGGINTVPR